MTQVAIHKDFLKAIYNIPRSQQKKVMEFTEKFRRDPTQASINYEPIHDMKDSKVRTVRIGLDYRAIIIHPQKGDVYLLVWVDHHDEAMRWAKNKVFEINENTGAIQVLDIEYINERKVKDVGENQDNGYYLFDKYSDKQLKKIGVPALLFPSIRNLKTEHEIDEISKHLPEEAYEGLLSLAAGFSFDQTMQELEYAFDSHLIDTDDFEKALEHPDTKRRFATLSSTEELMDILDAPLEKWRVFLHPSQKKLVTGEYKGSTRVLGGAGTGKTVVAMHRAKFLAEKMCNNSSDKILFLTFTSNLAKVIDNHLDSIVKGETRNNIEVTTVHSWSKRLLNRYRIYFNTVNEDNIEMAWREAYTSEELGFDLSFYKEEWEEVVQQHGINNVNDYLRIPRVGRGTRVSRLQRSQIWKVLEHYRNYLDQHQIKEWIDVVRDARKVIEQTNSIFPYKAIIVDEAQDLHQEDYKLMRMIVPEGDNDLFIVGDAHQRIYKNKVVLSHCGINIRGIRSKKLRINYRTTEEIRRWAVSILNGEEFDDLDGELDNQNGYKSLLYGSVPEVRHFNSKEEELNFINDFINTAILEGVELSNICIVTRSKKLLQQVYEPMLKNDNIPFIYLNPNENAYGEGIRLGTIHRVKGLEFSHLIISSVNDGIVPPISILKRTNDEISKNNTLLREKSLLYVAATRARDYLLVTSYNKQSELLVNLKKII
ncbi:hypothetical protein CIB95_08955 [Lottiidibacillus patelloidae]|uniref:DNA 3'-5' helicase n=1 Tax=Lottiidibacillus patelloidae TaxID=2670334 RepID=A0A263BT67_9BACI|nr:UvrD-helicase domain-containing protein [Lottiidibacillus patelloidae]OZM56889.1 hypothetical protein CIB95_08955 [Lottiidibacillus patelloidae]